MGMQCELLRYFFSPLLRETKLLDDIASDPELLELILTRLEHQVFEHGDTLFLKHETCNSLYFVLRGMVETSSSGNLDEADDQRFVGHVLDPDGFYKKAHRRSTRAVGKCEILILRRNVWQHLLSERPALRRTQLAVLTGDAPRKSDQIKRLRDTMRRESTAQLLTRLRRRHHLSLEPRKSEKLETEKRKRRHRSLLAPVRMSGLSPAQIRQHRNRSMQQLDVAKLSASQQDDLTDFDAGVEMPRQESVRVTVASKTAVARSHSSSASSTAMKNLLVTLKQKTAVEGLVK
ncbi:MAG: hypothetical protein MHM6MM_005445 [Cercozoa sp. M6MM]